MSLWRTTRSAAAVGPFPVGYRRLNPPSPQTIPEVSTVVTLVTRKARGSPSPSVTRWTVLPLPFRPEAISSPPFFGDKAAIEESLAPIQLPLGIQE